MGNEKKYPPLLIAAAILALLIPLDCAGAGLRNRIKTAIIERIDEKSGEQQVLSTLHQFEHAGRQRSYYLYLPSSMSKEKLWPVVFLFHGGGGGARGALFYYEMEKKAEESGFILVAPNGTGEAKNVLLTWNVGFGFGYAQKNRIDEAGFITALIKDLEKRYPVDPDRIYATGMSNGAILCHLLAAQPDNRFAAIAPVVGTLGGREQHETGMHLPPAPQTPVSVCIIQGLLDQSIPINGGRQQRSVGEAKIVTSASDTIDFWVKANNCNTIASSTYMDSLKTSVHHFPGGKNNTTVTAYIIHNMGHAWPGSSRVPRKGSDKPATQFPGNDIIWDFFSSHPRQLEKRH
jgi:polyhydroxybutyrate depolymerase